MVSSATATAEPAARPEGSPWSVMDAAKFLGASERHIWRGIDGGTIRSIRFGRRVLVPDVEIKRLAEQGE